MHHYQQKQVMGRYYHLQVDQSKDQYENLHLQNLLMKHRKDTLVRLRRRHFRHLYHKDQKENHLLLVIDLQIQQL
jgi:hypothetical protein